MPFLNSETQDLNNYILHCGYLRSVTGDDIRSLKRDHLYPTLLYMKENKVVDSYFGGLLFEADRATNGEILSAKAIGFGAPSSVASWQQATDALFHEDQNLSIALQISKQLPKNKMLDIWIALPYPVETKQDFGYVNGHLLNFRSNPTDREIAVKWWIDCVVKAWSKLSQKIAGHNARICGFAWTKNSLGSNDETLIAVLSQYVHQHQLKLMWCQNYGTAKGWEGYKLGFDLVFTRPLYNDTEQRGTTWIQYAAKFSNAYNLGLIVCGEPRNSAEQLLNFLEAGNKLFNKAFQIIELGDSGIYEFFQNADSMYDSLYTYMNGTFKKIPRSN